MWPASRRSENNGLERWFRNASGLATPKGTCLAGARAILPREVERSDTLTKASRGCC
jgi:hypothetical protein